jgi:hypothetical protein
MDETPITTKIKRDLLDSMYYRDVKYNLKSRFRWKFIGDLTEALSHVFTGVATILAFASGFFGIELLAFLSGCFGAISLVILQFSSYAVKESRERTIQVNRILRKLGMEEIADITIDSTGVSNNQHLSTKSLVHTNQSEPNINETLSYEPTTDTITREAPFFSHYAVDV